MRFKKCKECCGYFPAYQAFDKCVICRAEKNPNLFSCKDCGMLREENFHKCQDIDERVKASNQLFLGHLAPRFA